MTGNQGRDSVTAESARIRILAVISDLDGGGAERQFSLLLTQLCRRRFDIHVCFWRPVFRYPLPDDVTVHMVKKHKSWHVFPAIWGMRQLIDTLRPDLVYTQLHYVNMVTGTALAMTRHHPRWICRQVNDPRREMPHFFGVWARWALRRVDRMVGCSKGVRNEVVRFLRVPEKNTVNLDNLADIECIRRDAEAELPIVRTPEAFVVVHAGRLHPQKNQRLLLDAFARLERPAELWILGEGPLESELKQRAVHLGIDPYVRWLGFRENPFPFYRAADCLALTSHFEGLPNVVIEAMVCGTPVVATQCAYGPDELIDHDESGLLVSMTNPASDITAFATALSDLQRDKSRRERLGTTAHRRVTRRFDLDRCGRAYVQLFESVLDTAQE